MSPGEVETTMVDDPIEELREWLDVNWDPELTVAQWWERLGLAGWSAPLLPVDSYGRGLSRSDALRAQALIASCGALGAPQGLGLALAAPTIVTHGTRAQVDAYVRDIVTGQRGWCQLFSEPGAGSDLASLSTRATRDGDVWIVNGQKVWTSGGHLADLGMLLARTNPSAPKHQGITWFVLDMHQSGVEVRPLREMTGSTMFSEVFFTDAEVLDVARVGDVDNGWRVANTTLHIERSGMGAGGDAPARGTLMARAGTIAGDLDKRAGDFVVRANRPSRRAASPTGPRSPAHMYIELARNFGKNNDPLIRQALVRLHSLREIIRLNTERHKAVRATGGDIAGIANFSKLAMGNIVRLQRDLGLQILGARAMLHAYDDDGRAVVSAQQGGSAAALVTAQALSAQALPIFGGTDQIQRNIIGERTLGLPKEPGDLSHVPFSELPKNS
jgi:alkylation response protein AidB-like acyl-CoA dehydrogenase